MADAYLRSPDGNDADDGLTWANAEATLVAALVTAGDGGRVFMADAHAETQASGMSLASPGVSGTPTAVICVDDTGNPEPPTALALTGTVSTTGASNIAHTGHAACYGFTENVASAASLGSWNFTSAASWYWQYRSCVLVLRGTSGSARMVVGSTSATASDALLEWFACDAQFNATAQAINPATMMRWYGGSVIAGGVAPTGGLLKLLAGTSPFFEGRGLDLANVGNNPFCAMGTACHGGSVDLLNSRVSNSATPTTGTIAGPGMPRVRWHNISTDSVVGYSIEVAYEGQFDSVTGTFRTGGASQFGVEYSHRVQTSAGASFYTPFCVRYAIPVNSEDVSLTLTIEFVHDSVTALHDGDIWYELESPGTLTQEHEMRSGRRPILPTTTTNWGSSSVTWTSTGFTNENKQKMTVTLTPAQPGVWYLRVCVAKPSYTVLIDPPQRAQVA